MAGSNELSDFARAPANRLRVQAAPGMFREEMVEHDGNESDRKRSSSSHYAVPLAAPQQQQLVAGVTQLQQQRFARSLVRERQKKIKC